MKNKKQRKKPEAKKKKTKKLEDLKKLILQKIQRQKTSLDKKLVQETKTLQSLSKKEEARLEIKLEREKRNEVSSEVGVAPDFGETRSVETPEAPTYQRLQALSRPDIQRSLEAVAQQGAMTEENNNNITYSASTDLYGRRTAGGTSTYAPREAIEGNIARDIVIDDAIRRERELFSEQDLKRYREDSLTQGGMPQEIFEGRRMEEFINRKQESTYNPNRVLTALEKDKKELEQKYKRGLIK